MSVLLIVDNLYKNWFLQYIDETDKIAMQFTT